MLWKLKSFCEFFQTCFSQLVFHISIVHSFETSLPGYFINTYWERFLVHQLGSRTKCSWMLGLLKRGPWHNCIRAVGQQYSKFESFKCTSSYLADAGGLQEKICLFDACRSNWTQTSKLCDSCSFHPDYNGFWIAYSISHLKSVIFVKNQFSSLFWMILFDSWYPSVIFFVWVLQK